MRSGTRLIRRGAKSTSSKYLACTQKAKRVRVRTTWLQSLAGPVKAEKSLRRTLGNEKAGNRSGA